MNLEFQIWDRDLFKSNDFISAQQLDISQLIKEAVNKRRPVALINGKIEEKKDKNSEKSFILKTIPNRSQKDPSMMVNSSLRIQIELVPED